MVWGVHVTLVSRWLDPGETEALITPFMVLYALHDALVKPMPGNISTPSLAESWSVSKDGLTYDFLLRRNAKFHNGDPVTADDVKFTFERYKGASARLLKEKVKEVQVVAPNRVRFVLREAWPDFIAFYGTSATGASWIVPKKYVEKVGEDGFKKAPVGAGPFKFVSFQPGVELVLEAFPDYWRKPPKVKRIVMRSIPDESTRAAAVKTGEVDIAFLFVGAAAEDLKRSPGVRLTAPLLYGIYWLDFLDQWDAKSPWHDKRVRQAASLVIDRAAINQAEMLGYGKTTGGFVPPEFDFALKVEPPPLDPKRAKQLITEAGYPNGFDAGDLTPLPPYTSLAETVGGYLQGIGIRSRVRTMERATFMTTWHEKYLKGLQAQECEVWLRGERVKDVTTHPGLANGVRAIASLYDLQHELSDEMTYVSPTSGERLGLSFIIPRTRDELARRGAMMLRWARTTCGMMGRSPDFMNVTFAAWAAAAGYFARGRPEFGENMRRYYEYISEHDLTLTHSRINLPWSR